MFIVFLFIYFLDYLIGSVLKTFYFKQESGLQYRTTYSIEKTNANLLVFGSSAANHNYEPNTLQNKLNTSFYTTGRDGSSIFYAYAILSATLKRYSPNVVILNFDIEEFGKNQKSYDRLSSLLPYYKTHPEFRSIIHLKSPYEKYKLLSHIYPFNSSIFTIAIGNMKLNKIRSKDVNGYVELTNVWNGKIDDGDTNINKELDSNKIKVYNSFIENCIKRKIKLYIVCSPLFVKPNYKSKSIAIGKKIANSYNIKFFDYSKDSMFLNRPELFADVNHLNDDGAKIFSSEIADKILADDMQP